MDLGIRGRRAIVVPRIHPRREQLIRAERFRDLGLVRVIHPDALEPAGLARVLDDELQNPSAPTQRLDFGGLQRALDVHLPYSLEAADNGDVEVVTSTGSFSPQEVSAMLLRELKAGAEEALGEPVEEAIITVVDGVNTWEQLSATLNQVEERELDDVLLVSDGHHNYRLLAIADELGLEAFVSPSSAGATRGDYLREATAVSIGRIFGYRRLSNAVS